MKVAVIGESPTDQAALAQWVSGIAPTEITIVRPELRVRGWPGVVREVQAIIPQLHYGLEADGLVVVVDGNDTRLFSEGDSDGARQRCRLVKVGQTVREALGRVSPVSHRPVPLRVAVGVASPAIEAWLLVDRNPDVSEASWRAHLDSAAQPGYDRRSLKVELYGSDRAPTTITQPIAREAAKQIVDGAILEHLLARFPIGFGHLHQEVRTWFVGTDT